MRRHALVHNHTESWLATTAGGAVAALALPLPLPLALALVLVLPLALVLVLALVLAVTVVEVLAVAATRAGVTRADWNGFVGAWISCPTDMSRSSREEGVQPRALLADAEATSESKLSKSVTGVDALLDADRSSTDTGAGAEAEAEAEVGVGVGVVVGRGRGLFASIMLYLNTLGADKLCMTAPTVQSATMSARGEAVHSTMITRP